MSNLGRVLYRPRLAFVDDRFQEALEVEVTADRFTAVRDRPQRPAPAPGETVVDLPGHALFPGTVNAHAHAFQSLLRGIGDDLPFLEWRDRALYRIGPRLSPEQIYTGSLFAFTEMLRYGVTTVAEFFYLHQHGLEGDRAVRKAAAEAGIRLVLARAFYDGAGGPPAFRETRQEAAERFAALAGEVDGDPGVMLVPAPHSVHAASPAMIQEAHRFSVERSVPLHIHVAEQPFEVRACVEEHGVTPLRLLDRLGVLDERTVVVHACHLDEGEKDLLAARGGRVVHCPGANLFLADGIADLPGLLRRGLRVALGTDGGCANSRLCVFDEMRLAAVLQKGVRQEATVITAPDVLRLGTRAAGEVLGLPVGRVEPGAFADFVLLDLEDPSLQPERALAANVVYSLSHRAIARVYVAGRLVVEDGDTPGVPLGPLAREIAAMARSW